MSGPDRPDDERDVLLEVTARAVVPTMLVFSVYLLLVGHYAPGGGFTGGLVAGLALVLRYVAADRSHSVRPDPAQARGGGALPVRPPVLIGIGLTVAVVTGLVPIASGDPALSSSKLAVHLPLLGDLETQSSLFLDVGVYLLVVGVIADLTRSLGAGIARDMRDARERGEL